MAKQDDYDWDDSLEWDDAYDEYDDSFDDVDDDRPVKKKKKKAAAKSSTKSSKSSKSSKTSEKNSGTKKSSKKSQQSSKKAKRRRILMVLAIILEIMLVAVICVGLWVSSLYNNRVVIDRNITFGQNGQAVVNEIPSGTIEKMKGYTTYAIFGLDARDMNQMGAGSQADVIIVATLNNDTGEVNMVSVYRDTFLQVDGTNRFGKINHAYNLGGPLQAVESLNINLDLAIDHYVAVNWGAVVEAIDLLGGVDIEISEALYYAEEDLFGGTWLNSYIEQTARAIGYTEAELAYITYPEGPGYQHLNGLQAVALCRIRQVGADYERTANQRAVISQMIAKAKNANPATLYAIAEQILPNVATDMKLSYITSLLTVVSKVYVDQSAGFPSSRSGNEEDPVISSGTEWKWCIYPKDLLFNVAELHEILYNNYSYEPSATVKNISSQISALTGCYR